MNEINDLLFDIVMCVGPNDITIVDQVLPYTKKNVIGYRNIYLVCSNPDIFISDTITVDEKLFTYKKRRSYRPPFCFGFLKTIYVVQSF